MTQHADAVAALTAWAPPDHNQAALREGFLALLAARPDACERRCAPGHLTASVVVLNAAGTHTALVAHSIVGRWLQPGGHLEPGETIVQAAAREALEETCIPDLWLDPLPLNLHIHPITCRNSPPTRHFDVRFVAVAPEGANLVAAAGSDDVAWWPLDDLPDLFDEVHELIALALARQTNGRVSETT